MAQSGLIEEYEAVLFAELPAALAEEVSDGLHLAYETYLRQGLPRGDAAAAAVAEFGAARMVTEAFSRASPAGRAARALVVTGPLVGLCWAAELIAGRAWDWPVPVIVPVLVGAVLVGSIAVLVAAVRGRAYRFVRRSGVTGCAGVIVVDLSMITAVVLAGPGARWLAVVAIGASTTRLLAVVRALRPMLT